MSLLSLDCPEPWSNDREHACNRRDSFRDPPEVVGFAMPLDTSDAEGATKAEEHQCRMADIAVLAC